MLFDTVQLEIIIWLASTPEGRATGDSALTRMFANQTFHNVDLKPKLRLVGTTTPPTTTGE